MFGKRKHPILTKDYCKKMEKLRLAVEVLTGKRVSFYEFDFNSNKGKLFIEGELKDIRVEYFSENKISFHMELGIFSEYHAAHFDESEEIKIGTFDEHKGFICITGRLITIPCRTEKQFGKQE